jgi:hypothetical protein
MSGTLNRRTFGMALAAGAAAGLLAKPRIGAAQSSREADGARLLKGALDLHFHMRSTGRPVSRRCGWRARAACAVS